MKNYTNEELCLIFIDSFLEIDYKIKREILNFIDDKTTFEDFTDKVLQYLVTVVGGKEYNTIKASANKEYLDFLLENLDKKGVEATTYLSNDYPKALINITCPPIVIYYKGNLEILNEDTFAIVGSRKSLSSSINIAKRYTEELINANFTLVTGIAEGIDEAVLTKVLERGGKAVSVIAGGLDKIYPKRNSQLAEKISENGLILSEYPLGTLSKPYYFPIRNRIIAGLSKGVLIVSAGIKSGTFYTAEYANDFGKDLFAIPYSVGVLSGAGCNELIKKGAILTDCPTDIIDFYGKTVKKIELSLSSVEKEVINALKDGELHIEKLSTLINKKVFELTPILSILEIKGIIVKSGNVYGLIRNDLED